MLDASVFKKLAHNDTGKARGHQGGIVIPKAISQFFPPLPAVAAVGGPTVDSILVPEVVPGYPDRILLPGTRRRRRSSRPGR
jgi:putative restriction endonuclease